MRLFLFDALTQNELLQIIDLLLAETEKALKEKNLKLEVSKNAKNYIF